MRLANTTTSTEDPLPYILIRTAKGVTLEGIDGVSYLAQGKDDQPTGSEALN
jgi:hypothetical protein